MNPEKLRSLKCCVQAFSHAFRDPLFKENSNVQKISDMLDDSVNYLCIAIDYRAFCDISNHEIDLEEFKYKLDCAMDDVLECIESIQATMRTNKMCDKLKMALTGACLLIKSEIERARWMN